MLNGFYQPVVCQLSKAIDRVIGVIDSSGNVMACSDLTSVGIIHNELPADQLASGEKFISGDYAYCPFNTKTGVNHLVFVEGADDIAFRYGALVAESMLLIKQYDDDKYDKTNFIKNLILDNVMPGDIYPKARELHLNTDANRVCLIIRTSSKADISPIDILQNLFPDKNKDFVISINENDIALVKEITSDIELSSLEQLARSIVDTLSGEFIMHCIVGIGTQVTEIQDLSTSFKHARSALEVGKIFDIEKNIVSYENLGIARLIYQLPDTLCEMFLREVFKKGSVESLDQETLFTIQKFFENNLNVSETSRKLFVHRNTLVYRLEKIKRLTGLDLREFDHAIIFKVALMVKKYLTNKPAKYF